MLKDLQRMKTVIVNTKGYWKLQKQLSRCSCGYFLLIHCLRVWLAEAHRKQLQATEVVLCEQSLAHITGCSQYHIWASETYSLCRLFYSLGCFAPMSGKQHPGSIHHVFWRQFHGGSVKIHQQQAPQKKTSGSDSCCPQSRVWLVPSNKERGCVFVSDGKTKYWTAAH